VYDDCRQDALAIQVIQLCKTVFDQARLGLYLFPYRVIPTRTGTKRAAGGILECVPDVRSRDEIGKAGFPTLHDFFVSTFGRPDGAEFEVARRNMVRSLAAYAVVCYLLRIKDRHNGNLLVSGKGHLVHIDFGFLLGISPGGNLGFETAAFKLTQEMVDVMGGSTDTEMFRYFSELTCRAFLLARDNMDAIHALVAGMADSGLPCFLFPDTLPKLWGRFRPDDGPLRAGRFMRDETVLAARSVTTVLYDGIQKLQNNIHSEAWQ
jgi:phosphatidylinositol 4-kinase